MVIFIISIIVVVDVIVRWVSLSSLESLLLKLMSDGYHYHFNRCCYCFYQAGIISVIGIVVVTITARWVSSLSLEPLLLL